MMQPNSRSIPGNSTQWQRKVIVAVAPVAHVDHPVPNGTRNPVTPEEIAQDVVDCFREGASMVHLHVRDRTGKQVSDLTTFTKTIDLIRKESDILIQGSTGGVSSLTLEERCVSVDEPRTQLASLNMGSTNLGEGVYVNTLPDIRFWARRMKEKQVVPELEIFSLGMIESVLKLKQEGVLCDPLNFNLCVGFEGALPARPIHLFHFLNSLPAGSHWSLIHEGMKDMSLLLMAVTMGASGIRVGFEDGCFLTPSRPAKSNRELVRHLVTLLRGIGYEPATVQEAKEFLGVLKNS
ncbi:MAG: 3-keto-5-aminohexanoate cleavage protein [Spirochaetes bacterium]|nr:3-keto-5-aminohexanoate cleavage protein [Spirochaetota bacterium]